MIEDLETRVRAAAPDVVPEIDVGLLRMRSSSRQRRRRALSALTAVAILIGALGAIVAIRSSGGDDSPADHVRVPVRLPALSWTNMRGVPGVAQVVDVASSKLGVVAVGISAGSSVIWFSPDGSTWEPVYSEPNDSAGPRPPTDEQPQTETRFREVVAIKRGFFVAGSRETSGANGSSRSFATVIASPDGRTWRPAENRAFLPASTASLKSGIASTLYGLTEARGQLIAVGDVFTNNKEQTAGLSPCVWTSRDGVHWQRKIADLGDGFDPYFTSISVRDGHFVASGRTGKSPLVAWISDDLVHWEHHTIVQKGGAGIVATTHGFVAFGSINVGTLERPVSEATLWWSDDGQEWQRVLHLPAVADDLEAGFSAVLEADGVLLAVRRGYGTATRAEFYESVDARTWARVEGPAAMFPAQATLSGAGTITDWLAIAGNIPDAGAQVFWTTTS